MAADRIRMNAPEGAYDIVIEPGILHDPAALAEFFPVGGSAVVISNETVAGLHGHALIERLPGAALALMGDGEQYKNLETVSALYAEMIAAGADRGTVVVALGGGVVGDTAGFVAATYMRGVRLVQMPTSLLAMVDSSVGGKVGIDLPQGKNLVGAFKQPAAVLIDPAVLATLPDHEWRNGMAEVIKHGLLADSALLDPQMHDRAYSAELVRRAVQVKVDVVTQDPYEDGVRAHLNLGHTFAHAIEQVSAYAWAHGAAVSVGLLAAARLSALIGLCDSALPEEVEDLLTRAGMPCRIGAMDPDAIYAAMRTDKKWRGGRSRFVLLRAVGAPVVVEDVGARAVLAVLAGLRD